MFYTVMGEDKKEHEEYRKLPCGYSSKAYQNSNGLLSPSADSGEI